jgi:hypothetical protein
MESRQPRPTDRQLFTGCKAAVHSPRHAGGGGCRQHLGLQSGPIATKHTQPMKPELTRALHGRRSRLWAGCLCLVLFLALQALAVSTPLHLAIHPDAGNPGHHCAITLVTHGQLTAPTTLSVVLNISTVFFQAPAVYAAPHSFEFRFSPSRAPPCF